MDQSSNVEQALEAQQALVETSLQLVFEAYDDALERNIRCPVVFVLDCEDSVGSEIARAWLGDDTVDAAIAAQKHESPSANNTTVFAHAFPFAKCQKEVPPVFPYLDPVWKQPSPRDGFLTVGVTCAGASVFTVPFDARP